jgi:transcriptional regulator with XRE-family HTH domain
MSRNESQRVTIKESRTTPLNGEAMRRAELRSFLRIKRAAIDPTHVGFPLGPGKRRRQGLRLEEAAALAGVGLTWYAAFERGRPIRVSRNMLDGVARALSLSDIEALYLRTLVEPVSKTVPETQPVPSVYLELIDGFVTGPALILNIRWDVQAWNSIAARVYYLSGEDPPRERNLVWRMFTDPRYESMHVEWARLAAQMVAILHMHYGMHAEDSTYHTLVADLRRRDPRFETLWTAYRLSDYAPTAATLEHPVFGRLDFNYVGFTVSGAADPAPRFRVVLQVPVTGTHTATRLRDAARFPAQARAQITPR